MSPVQVSIASAKALSNQYQKLPFFNLFSQLGVSRATHHEKG